MSPALPVLPALRLLMLSPSRIAGTQILDAIFSGLADQGTLTYRALFDVETAVRARRAAIAESDVILLFRSYTPESLELLRYAKQRGKLVIYSTDDDFLALDPASPLGRVHHLPANRNAYDGLFREADLVWLFTEEMHRRYGPLNPTVIVGRLPCGVEHNHPSVPSRVATGNDEPCVIGYGSSTPHREEWQFLVPPLHRLLERYGSKVRIELVNAPADLLPYPNVQVLPAFDDLQAYYAYLRGPRWAIGLAPLKDTAFNRAKTNNKYREYAGLGVAGIYSDVPVYADCVHHGETGYLTSYDEGRIYEAMCTLVEQPALRAHIARAALQDAASRYTLRAAQLDFLRLVSLLAIRAGYRGWRAPTLLLVGSDGSSSMHIHALQPCRELQRQGLLRFEWRLPGELGPQCFAGIDAVYVVRAFQPETVVLLQEARRRHVPLISSWDDDFVSIPRGTSFGDYLHHPAVRRAVERFLRESSLLVASTPPLAQRSRDFNLHVMEAAYGLDAKGLDAVAAEVPRPTPADGKIRVGFYGVNAAIGNAWMVEALRQLRARYGSRLIIELIGCAAPPGLRDVVDWFSESLLPYADSSRLLRSRGWDIGLSPLEDTPFNAAKQATKFRDYTWAGIAMVCSRVPTYERDLLDGVHCSFAENTAASWAEAIGSLVEDPAYAASLRQGAAALLAAAHTQEVTNATWYQLAWRVGVHDDLGAEAEADGRSEGAPMGSPQQSRSLERALARRQADLVDALDELTRLESIQAKFEEHAIALTNELDGLRRRRVLRWLDRLRRPEDLSGLIDPAFQSLKDGSRVCAPELERFALGPSGNLQLVPFVGYPIEPRRPGLCGVLLAPIVDFPMRAGTLGVTVISSAADVVAHGAVPLSEIDEHVPTRVTFPAIGGSDPGRLWLRVFVRDAAFPVRLFEWRRYRFGGLGRLERRAFCRLLFDQPSASS